MTVLIDTCVIIDVLQSRKPFAAPAQTIFLAAANDKFSGCITANSVLDIYYLTHKLTHSDAETRDILTKLFSLFAVVDTRGGDCINALLSSASDYEDAVMIECAKREGIDCIVTRNTADYVTSPVPVYAPEEFMRLLEGNSVI